MSDVSMDACCELRTVCDVIQCSAVQYIFLAFSILTTFVVLCVATRVGISRIVVAVVAPHFGFDAL